MAEVGALFGVAAQMPPPTGPFFGHLAVNSGFCVVVLQRFANDPPDLNYRTAVRPARSLASTVEMREHLKAPDWAIGLTTALGDAGRYADAAIRAYERAQGASAAENPDAHNALLARLSETREYADIAVEPVGEIAAWADRFAVIFNELFPENLVSTSEPPEDAGELPEATLASLYRAGIPLKTLNNALRTTSLWAMRVLEPTEPQMRELASSARDFAGFLRAWAPSV
jgi:hypothetical protein